MTRRRKHLPKNTITSLVRAWEYALFMESDVRSASKVLLKQLYEQGYIDSKRAIDKLDGLR